MIYGILISVIVCLIFAYGLTRNSVVDWYDKEFCNNWHVFGLCYGCPTGKRCRIMSKIMWLFPWIGGKNRKFLFQNPWNK